MALKQLRNHLYMFNCEVYILRKRFFAESSIEHIVPDQ